MKGMNLMKYEYDKRPFNSAQQHFIDVAIFHGDKQHKEILDIMTTLNKEGKPVFDNEQLRIISASILNNVDVTQIKLYAKLNSNVEPIYNSEQMKVVYKYITDEVFPKDAIDICLKTVSEVPVFEDYQMDDINSYIENEAGPKEIRQLRECVNDGLEYEQIEFFLNNIVDADGMRICKSLYSLGCSVDNLEELNNCIDNSNDLKNVKYFLQCAKHLDLDISNLLKVSPFTPENIENALCKSLMLDRGMHGETFMPLISVLFSSKLPPEQIDYITRKENAFHMHGMKQVAIGFLNGLTLKDVENAFSDYKIHTLTTKEITRIIDEATREKFSNLDDIEKDVEIKTDWFDNIYR